MAKLPVWKVKGSNAGQRCCVLPQIIPSSEILCRTECRGTASSSKTSTMRSTIWRRGQDSNLREGLCRPSPSRLGTASLLTATSYGHIAGYHSSRWERFNLKFVNLNID
jgi:hypothetical protein